MKIVNGNINNNLKVAAWNCRRGLICGVKEPSSKVTEIKEFMYSNNIHTMGIIEADIHGKKSRILNRQKLTTEEAMRALNIEGYNLYLPQC